MTENKQITNQIVTRGNAVENTHEKILCLEVKPIVRMAWERTRKIERESA